MSSRVRCEDWRPADGIVLESVVDRAVRSTVNTIVIAGPGAGKTELLAQRACFLLETGVCPLPKRILALSFKRDAARNLEARVAKRCAPQHARRFDSLTFESFGKTLLDRFGRALPKFLQPDQQYEINFDIKERQANTLIGSLPDTATTLTTKEIESVKRLHFYREYFTARLTSQVDQHRSIPQRLASDLWHFLLHQKKPSQLNFEMIDLLAELIIRLNPQILKALRSSYSFVFLDEFQDTTGVQYELIKTAFHGSSAILTAVGDDKQRIMGWANALKGIFLQYEKEFGASQVRPMMNYRSAPGLVAIQQVFAEALDSNSRKAVAHDNGSDGNGECHCFLFSSYLKEAQYIADLIQKTIADGIDPRDICVLTRTKSPYYTDTLIEALAKRDLKARVESDMQDLLAESLTITLLDLFKLAALPKAPSSWSATMNLLQAMGGDEEDKSCREIERRLSLFISAFRTAVAAVGADKKQIRGLVDSAMGFVGEAAFILRNQAYCQGNWYQKQKTLFIENMTASRLKYSWKEAIADFEGIGSVPMMTMHKSKGLEYHTIIFVGLEDEALFGWARDDREERCGFFVALSRAKKKAVFTFSDQRIGSQGLQTQSRAKIKVLYELMVKAGVHPQTIV